ncbi:hypothetical protein B0H16DRAFT_1456407 [Mycena metata]|uniref:Uncharacterized protein n=1 Tax=Mycena metata TaxID=1033252 RepID=A0AAD7NHB6_9AGAR|nr:hypothetical protein B0H16DRAFT_1456407 [Mycena metata]
MPIEKEEPSCQLGLVLTSPFVNLIRRKHRVLSHLSQISHLKPDTKNNKELRKFVVARQVDKLQAVATTKPIAFRGSMRLVTPAFKFQANTQGCMEWHKNQERQKSKKKSNCSATGLGPESNGLLTRMQVWPPPPSRWVVAVVVLQPGNGNKKKVWPPPPSRYTFTGGWVLGLVGRPGKPDTSKKKRKKRLGPESNGLPTQILLSSAAEWNARMKSIRRKSNVHFCLGLGPESNGLPTRCGPHHRADGWLARGLGIYAQKNLTTRVKKETSRPSRARSRVERASYRLLFNAWEFLHEMQVWPPPPSRCMVTSLGASISQFAVRYVYFNLSSSTQRRELEVSY